MFENAHLEQDEAMTTSTFMTDQTAGQSDRGGYIQRASQKVGKEAWICDREASTQMTFSSTGISNYRKCKRLVRCTDGRSLKIGCFGDIIVMFRSDESIIPLKLYNVAHVIQISQNLFSLAALQNRGHGFTGSQGEIVVSLQQALEEIGAFDQCGNLYQKHGSRPTSAGSAFIAVNDANVPHPANDKSYVVMRKVEKQGVTVGFCPTRRGKQRAQRRGRRRAA